MHIILLLIIYLEPICLKFPFFGGVILWFMDQNLATFGFQVIILKMVSLYNIIEDIWYIYIYITIYIIYKYNVYIYIYCGIFLWRAYSVSTARFSPKIRKFKNSKIQKIEKKHENSKIQKIEKPHENSKIRKFEKTKKHSKIRKNTLKFKIRKFHQPESISQGIHSLATHQAEKIIDKGQEMKAPLLKNAASMLQKYPSKTSSKRHDMTRITWKNESTHSRKSFKQEMWRETYKRHHHVWGDWTEMQANLVQNDPANTSRAKGSS